MREVVALPALQHPLLKLLPHPHHPDHSRYVTPPAVATLVLFMNAHNKPAAPCVFLGPGVCMSHSALISSESSWELNEQAGGQAVGIKARKVPPSGGISVVPWTPRSCLWSNGSQPGLHLRLPISLKSTKAQAPPPPNSVRVCEFGGSGTTFLWKSPESPRVIPMCGQFWEPLLGGWVGDF